MLNVIDSHLLFMTSSIFVIDSAAIHILLLSSPPVMDCSTCLSSSPSSPDCLLVSDYCRTFCPDIYLSPLDCPSSSSSSKSHKFHPALLLALLLLSSAFLLLSSFALYLRYRFNRRTPSLPHPSAAAAAAPDQFLDLEPALDHPLWYINTVGLTPSVITSITVCNYKRGDGLVEGTDCSVCLNEFHEGDALRLLPKCSHAFHIPCIDTWLLSHTSCPMCRAGILFGSARVSLSSEIPRDGGDEGYEAVASVIGDCLEEGVGSLNVKEEGRDGVNVVRRSASMDCIWTSTAFTNSFNSSSYSSVVTINEEFPLGNGDRGAACSSRFTDCSSVEGVGQQPVPGLVTRSFSCGAKLLLQRYGRS